MDISPDDADANRHAELSYEKWRDRMIAEAKAILNAETQEQNQNQMD